MNRIIIIISLHYLLFLFRAFACYMLIEQKMDYLILKAVTLISLEVPFV